jgi:hypothetical protein
MSIPLRVTLAIAAIGLAAAMPTYAVPVTYTFSGTASGVLLDAAGTETDFTDALFTIVLEADTTAIQPDDPYYRIFNLGGTFSQGAFSATLSPLVAIVVNSDPAFENVNFFNGTFDNGLGFWEHPALDGYHLATSIGPLTVPSADAPLGFLSPTYNDVGGAFAFEGGGSVQFTGDTSLTFSARVQGVPEPATAMLVLAALAALGLARRKAVIPS